MLTDVENVDSMARIFNSSRKKRRSQRINDFYIYSNYSPKLRLSGQMLTPRIREVGEVTCPFQEGNVVPNTHIGIRLKMWYDIVEIGDPRNRYFDSLFQFQSKINFVRLQS